jgi:AmmeMemoRadiSam system protein B
MEDNQTRNASHSGSWYTSNKNDLRKQLDDVLAAAEVNEGSNKLKGVIVPHAGYRFSAGTAAWAYRNINKDNYDRIVILGPSHHCYIPGCGLTQLKAYETPFGNLSIDTDSIQKLSKIKGFFPIDKKTDEEEHSLEMQLPFIKYIFGDKDVKILPIMVGQTDLGQDKLFAEALGEYYKDDNILFVISSDFCHWGSRFRFTYIDEKCEHIYQSIENLDRLGMDCIETLNAEKFNTYLKESGNTICGRRAISIYLCLAGADLKKNKIVFVNYTQSSQVTSMNDSSVSYAAGLNILL